MEKKISVGYDCYKSVVSDNEDLRNRNEALEEAVEHYQKSNKAWQEKYDNLFKKHQELLGAIRELEVVIDDYQKHREMSTL
jgi:Skp family chaperone for outer membrane proteins